MINLKKISGKNGFRRTGYEKDKDGQWVEYTSGSPATSDTGIRIGFFYSNKTHKMEAGLSAYDFKRGGESYLERHLPSETERIITTQKDAEEMVHFILNNVDTWM